VSEQDLTMRLPSGWVVECSPLGRRLDRNYFIIVVGDVLLMASSMANRDEGYEVSEQVITELARDLGTVHEARSWKDGVETVARATRRALSLPANAASGGERRVEGLSFTLVEARSDHSLDVFNLGSNVVLHCKEGRVEDVVEPHGMVPWGTRVAEPEKDCSADLRGTRFPVGADGRLVIIAPPSSVRRPFDVSPAGSLKVVDVLAVLGRPYKQYPKVFAALRRE